MIFLRAGVQITEIRACLRTFVHFLSLKTVKLLTKKKKKKKKKNDLNFRKLKIRNRE